MRRIGIVSVALIGLTTIANCYAHDSWISRGQLRNSAGEWCCGEGDCFVVPQTSVEMTGFGYRLFGIENVPFSETQPSPDGAFWRCKRPDGSRRCFFAPPPGS